MTFLKPLDIRTRRIGAACTHAACAGLLAACDRPATEAPSAGVPGAPSVSTPAANAPATAASAPAAASRAADAWLGRWTGPEGTFVDIAADGQGYRITIQSLDGPATYPGRAVADGIAFERVGSTEILRATDGPATGMKWLQDKKNCLTVRTGEGFCRD
ncbi:MAG: hypothetical protein KA795_02685 [Burkholderiaceae bacterium]|nr:hypothetical protein [Burkholderiaceae bacterium]